jgi:hypothetical protein
MTDEAGPPELLREPISEMPRWYTKMFWDMVASSGSDRALVQSASLKLRYDLSSNRWKRVPDLALRIQNDPENQSECAVFEETPYQCDVLIVDTRGKRYSAHFEDWWLERYRSTTPVRTWWNPFSWFRRYGRLERVG